MALLKTTESALKQSQLSCEVLEEKLKKQLAENEDRHHRELSQREETNRKELSEQELELKKVLSDRGKVQQELSDRVTTSRNEMSELCDMRERKVQQWEKEKKELKEINGLFEINTMYLK